MGPASVTKLRLKPNGDERRGHVLELRKERLLKGVRVHRPARTLPNLIFSLVISRCLIRSSHGCIKWYQIQAFLGISFDDPVASTLTESPTCSAGNRSIPASLPRHRLPVVGGHRISPVSRPGAVDHTTSRRLGLVGSGDRVLDLGFRFREVRICITGATSTTSALCVGYR